MEIWDIYNKEKVKTGKTISRGEKLLEGEFHLVAHIWIKNSREEFLIQKRASHLGWMPGLWATTGGAAIFGEEALQAAIRETQEELGVLFNPKDFQWLFTRTQKDDIADIWLVKTNLPLSSFHFLKEEITEIKWESASGIQRMITEGSFVDYGKDYLKNLFI